MAEHGKAAYVDRPDPEGATPGALRNIGVYVVSFRSNSDRGFVSVVCLIHTLAASACNANHYKI